MKRYIVWYDIELDRLRIWLESNPCNGIAEFDEYMVRLGFL